MRLCADENVPGDAVAELRRRKHDVLWIRESAPGSADEAVLATAQTEARLLVTFDKDFGELVFQRGVGASRGIVLFRITLSSPAAVTSRVASALESRDDWEGNFSIVDDQVIRMRPLPPR